MAKNRMPKPKKRMGAKTRACGDMFPGAAPAAAPRANITAVGITQNAAITNQKTASK
jgi:hypothetical protein